MCDCPLSSALLSALTGEGGAPLKVAVSLTPSDEVTALRSQVADLTLKLAELQRDYNKVEFRYRCEVLLNFQLQDLMRAAGVPFPRRLRTTQTVEGFESEAPSDSNSAPF